jgi:AcrR family transcriptional regulator
MMPGSSKRYHHGNLRQTLLKEALNHLRTHGDADLSLRELAKISSVSANAPYRHFSSKDSLLAAIGAQGFRDLATQMENVQAPGPVKQFRELGQVVADFARDNGALFRLMFSFRHADPEAQPELCLAREGCFHKVVDSVRIVMNEPEVNEAVKERAVAAWSLFTGFAQFFGENSFPLMQTANPVMGRDVARYFARGIRG